MMELFTKKLNNRKGFTLIELIVVIAIIGILAAILIPQFGGFSEKAKIKAAWSEAKSVATAIDAMIIEDAAPADQTDTDFISLVGSELAGNTSDITSDGGFTYTASPSAFSTTRTGQGSVPEPK